MKNRVIFVATTINADLGGIARSVPALALTEAQRSGDTEVYFLAPKAVQSTLDDFEEGEGLHLRLCDGANGVKRQLEKLTSDPGQVRFISHAGVWDPLNHFVASLGRRKGIPVITSIRSMLDPWALNHRKWKKRLAWWAYARRDLLSATAIHATAKMEADFIRRALGPKCPPVFVVPNGVDLGQGTRDEGLGSIEPVIESGSRPSSLVPRPKRILFLSRIHEKKGVPDLIRAFGELNPDGWELVIAGNDDPSASSGQVGTYRQVCESLASKQPNADRILFLGAVRDADKWDLYRSADLFVLPSYSENFGIVVGEALGMGVPVVTTTATPWGEFSRTKAQRGQGTEGDAEKDLGLWIVEPGVDGLTKGLMAVMDLSDAQRVECGARGAEWIRREFAWESIGEKFLEEVGKVIRISGKNSKVLPSSHKLID